MKDLIAIEDFRKLDLHIGQIAEAERIEGSGKLLLLKVDLGQAKDSDESESREYLRQIVAGIGQVYEPEWLVGKQVVVLVNLRPRMVLGFESHGMLVAIDSKTQGPTLLLPEKAVEVGSVLC